MTEPFQRELLHFCKTPGCKEPAELIADGLPRLHCAKHAAIYTKQARAMT